MKNEERIEVFRGHFEECIRNFAKSLASKVPRGQKGVVAHKEPIAHFCGVGVHTVTRWLYHNGLPEGESYIKLVCYLDTIGYRVIELERMPQDRRHFFEMIGYSIISSEEAIKLLSYKSSSTLFKMLRGDQAIGGDRSEKMWNAWKERKDELERRKSQGSVAVARLVGSTNAGSLIEQLPVTKMQQSLNGRVVGHLVNALLDVFEESPSKIFLVDGLGAVGCSAEKVLHVSAHLSSLGSSLVSHERQAVGGVSS